jgi:hypothetical protein
LKKNKKILAIVAVLLLVNITILIPNNSIVNNDINDNNQETILPKSSNAYRFLLHSYDFEDETLGQDPTGQTLVVAEPSGCTANIQNLGDGQQNHVGLYKSGSSGRVMLRDNISYHGQTYEVGEIHFKFYHDTSLFGIWIIDSGGILFRLDFWSGNVGQWAISNIITSYTLNQWTDVVITYNISKGWLDVRFRWCKIWWRLQLHIRTWKSYWNQENGVGFSS